MIVKIPNTRSLRYVGQPGYDYVDDQFLGFTAIVSSYVNNYQILSDNRLFIGNAQNSSGGPPPGNPTHTGFSMDFNYYTRNLPPGQTPNATQYILPGMVVAQIWDDSGDLIPDRFHFQANYDLFRIIALFGVHLARPTIRISDVLYRAFTDRGFFMGFKTPGNEAIIQSDHGTAYNHHTHAHVDFYRK